MTTPADDMDRIMAVIDAAFDPRFGEAWTRRQIEDALLLGTCHYRLINAHGAAFPPEDPGPAAGFALLRTALDEEELLLFAIMPELRRRGLGAALLAQVIASARARDLRRILLEMRHGNSAEHLYLASGFHQIGVRPRYYHTPDSKHLDAITFSYLLG